VPTAERASVGDESRARLGRPGRAAPADSPAQLACIETVSRHALRGMLPPALVGLGLPLAIGAALRFFASGDRVRASAEALVALLFVVTGAGTLASLLFSTAGGAWDHAKKYIETGAHGGRYLADARATAPRGRPAVSLGDQAAGPAQEDLVDNPTYLAAVVGDTIGDALKGLLAPSVRSLVETLALLALVFLPFFI
jgi:K(+)-stimulated pyrophosphate-energized sodium pump